VKKACGVQCVAVSCAERSQCLKVDIATDVIKPDQSRLIDDALQACQTAQQLLDDCNNDQQ